MTRDLLIDRNKMQKTSRVPLEQKLVSISVSSIFVLSLIDPIILSFQGIGTNQAGGWGTGRIFSLIIIFFSLTRIPSLLRVSSFARLIFCQIYVVIPGFYLAVLGFAQTTTPQLSYLIEWVGYVLLALSVATWVNQISFERILSRAILSVLIIVSALTIIDYYTNIDIPYFNEVGRSYFLQTENDVLLAPGMLGPFLSRTQAAVVMESLVGFSLAYVFYTNSSAKKIMSFLAIGLSAVFMFGTGNRSFWMALGAAILGVIWVYGRSWDRRLKGFAILAVSGWLFISLFTAFMPRQASYYQSKIHETTLSASDEVRVTLLKVAVDSLSEGNLLGKGPSPIVLPGAKTGGNAHSIIAALIWSSGLPGVVWFASFILLLLGRMRRELNTPKAALASLFFIPILANLVGGLSHSSFANSNLWIFIGLFIGTVDIYEPEPPERTN